ncbi:MAG: 16S rRNA (cytosine(1402)-N(4))-methyltransferase RsmH [Candidatus Altimarinota bacterium]
MTHLSVLLPEVLRFFDLPHRSLILDATLGLGGHSKAILMDPTFSGRVIGIDQDQSHLQVAKKNLQDLDSRFRGVHMNFGELRHFLERESVPFDGILFDLGVASPHFDTAERGFSYQTEGPLDMRMNREQELTAGQIVNTWEDDQLTHIFYVYGEEALSRKISQAIVRPRLHSVYKNTTQLKDLIVDVYRSAGFYSSKKNPATKVFQALRIAVNDELRVLEEALKTSLEFIQPGGRIIVISYHSLEDRMVKDFFKSAENPCICPPKLPICACGRKPLLRILTKKPVVPTEEEVRTNPRARSAKMRVAEKIVYH